MENNVFQKSPIPAHVLIRLSVIAFFSGIIIGQLIDFSYPISNALHYHKFVWKVGPLEFCWMIDILYGVANVILWVSYILWDQRLGQEPVGGFNPSWRIVFTGCVFFIVQFYVSPYLSGVLKISNFLNFIFSMGTAILCWWLFDRTRTGVYVMITAGVLGPLAEITMINAFNWYHYTRPDIFGVPLWFIGAYTCGCAPCGNLARKCLSYLEEKFMNESTEIGNASNHTAIVT